MPFLYFLEIEKIKFEQYLNKLQIHEEITKQQQ